MKPTELQIGDWVLIDNTPRQVVQLTKSKVGYHTEPRECRMHYARYADVVPIRITADILEKNGVEFYSKNCNMWVLSIRANWSIEVGLWGDMGTLIRCSKQEPGGVKSVHLSDSPYIHQLQQAIRLCGIDKEIEI